MSVVAVIGAGRAGLAVSHELTARGTEHVVLERGRVAETWRGRRLERASVAWGDAPRADLTVGAVVFATGFDLPGGFDEAGFPHHAEGASTAAAGLYFAGVHFLRKRKSSLLIGVGEDAALVAGAIAQRPQDPG